MQVVFKQTGHFGEGVVLGSWGGLTQDLLEDVDGLGEVVSLIVGFFQHYRYLVQQRVKEGLFEDGGVEIKKTQFAAVVDLGVSSHW